MARQLLNVCVTDAKYNDDAEGKQGRRTRKLQEAPKKLIPQKGGRKLVGEDQVMRFEPVRTYKESAGRPIQGGGPALRLFAGCGISLDGGGPEIRLPFLLAKESQTEVNVVGGGAERGS